MLSTIISLSEKEVAELLDQQIPYVIRIKIPDAEQVQFVDMIRGEVSFDASTIVSPTLQSATCLI